MASPKSADYYVPDQYEQDILAGRAEQMQDMRKSVWEQVNKYEKSINILDLNVKYILSQLSKADKYIFKFQNSSFVLDPEILSEVKSSLLEVEGKMKYIQLLCQPDFQHLKTELSRIRNIIEKYEENQKLKMAAQEELRRKQKEKHKVKLELSQETTKLRSM